MKVYITVAYILIFFSNTVFSQSKPIIHEGEILFQKRVNAYAILDEFYVNNATFNRNKFAENYKSGNPQFGVTNFTLLFNDHVTLYSPNSKIANTPEVSLLQMLKIVYSDLTKNTFIAKKTIFDQDYLVGDTSDKVEWKITNEMKDIAGFSCRRANAIIMDSVYVVAFYTDRIVPRGGPEFIKGLPGMVLGVALPHEHMSWFATQVTAKQVPHDQIKPPSGGEAINNAKLRQALRDNSIIKQDKKTADLFIRNYLY